MHLGNKLRSAHINYTKQKMKVRLATQVFTKSTADSLLFCRNVLHLNDFKNCEATIRFLEMFNDLFDVSNSKNMKQICFNQALNSKNIESVTLKFTESKAYIISLRNECANSLIS